MSKSLNTNSFLYHLLDDLLQEVGLGRSGRRINQPDCRVYIINEIRIAVTLTTSNGIRLRRDPKSDPYIKVLCHRIAVIRSWGHPTSRTFKTRLSLSQISLTNLPLADPTSLSKIRKTINHALKESMTAPPILEIDQSCLIRYS